MLSFMNSGYSYSTMVLIR